MSVEGAPTDAGIELSNTSFPRHLLAAGGIQETRAYLRAAGMRGGLNWLPITRSRLYAEIRLQVLLGTFRNIDEDGVPLIGSMAQSFAQDLRNIRTVRQVRERALMPPARQSVRTLRRMQQWVGSGALYTNLYTEVLGWDETYNDRNAPFVRAQVICADQAYAMGYEGIDALVEESEALGITQFGFSNVHSVRPAQDNPSFYLPPWHEWLPGLLDEGKIGEVALTFARRELKPHDNPVLTASFDHMQEILRGDPRDSNLGDLPEMLRVIRPALHTPGSRPRVGLYVPAWVAAEVAPAMRPHEIHRVLGAFAVDRLGIVH